MGWFLTLDLTLALIICYGVIMPILTDEEADVLDELLTNTTVETNPNIQGPFIKNRERMIVLDTFSAEYLKSQMITTNKTPAQLINGMILREMELAKATGAYRQAGEPSSRNISQWRRQSCPAP